MSALTIKDCARVKGSQSRVVEVDTVVHLLHDTHGLVIAHLGIAADQGDRQPAGLSDTGASISCRREFLLRGAYWPAA